MIIAYMIVTRYLDEICSFISPQLHMQYQHDGCNCSRKCETGHSVCDDCAEQDDTKMPAGDGGSDEAKDTEEDAETGARGVRVVHGGPW